MIVEFTVENLTSLLENTTIDFSSGTASKLSGNLLSVRTVNPSS